MRGDIMGETNILRVIVKFLAAEAIALCYFLWGPMDGYMKTLIAFIVIDYITGVVAATKKHSLNSETGFKGITKKVMLLALVAVCNILDTQIIGGDKSFLRTAIVSLYIANEGLSIVENGGKFIPYPKRLKSFLEQLRDKSNSDDKEDDNNVQEKDNETGSGQ
jgi:toxin secretion/phage lysis holin